MPLILKKNRDSLSKVFETTGRLDSPIATFIVIGDVHATRYRPENRCDDYWETFKRKFSFIMNEVKSCDFGIQVGDLFNSYKAPRLVTSFLAEKLKFKPLMGVYGQHDMKYHSDDFSDTSMNILVKSGFIEILNDSPVLNYNKFIHIYGASWREEIPEIIDKNYFNILVAHRMVINTKLWAGQKDATWADELNNSGFDLILSGDNHQKFVRGKVINAGSIMRSTTAQLEHQPAIFKIRVWGDKQFDIQEIPIPIEPVEKVFNMIKVRREKEKSNEMNEFISGLDISGSDFSEFGFWDEVAKLEQENTVDEETKIILNEVRSESETSEA